MPQKDERDFQQEKAVVRAYLKAFDACLANGAPAAELTDTLRQHTADDYHWRGVHPFNEQPNAAAAVDSFWGPFTQSFTPIQRRMDFFFAGENVADASENQDTKPGSTWVINAGNFLGLFDTDFLGIPHTRKIAMLRYAEFHRVENGRIAETALFCDLLSLMHQAGAWPQALAKPMTGAPFIYPGPRTHDGLLFEAQDPSEANISTSLLKRMVKYLSELNQAQNQGGGNDRCPPELLAKTWHDDMLWYGPYGIGASYTIPRYQEQHQYPFREGLSDKVFNGHVARLSEGSYSGFFGWPNLNNKNTGGWLGLPQSDVHAGMRVVDLYRRDGDKLAENWVYIDMLHYLKQLGVDVLGELGSNSNYN